MSSLKAGSRLKSAVCDAEVMVVRAAAVEVSLECGGAGMIPMAADKPAGVAPSEAFAQGTLVGVVHLHDLLGKGGLKFA